MKCSKAGQFYGKTNETVFLEGIILNDADYVDDRVDWHFHENAYFTFILQGMVLEGNKKEIYECSAGSLLFHNWQDAHYNVKSNKFTRGFHVEIEPAWFSSFDIGTGITRGSIDITDPKIKILMYNIFKETKLAHGSRQTAIDALLIELFGSLSKIRTNGDRKRPGWVDKIREVLHDSTDNWRLAELAALANVHPVYLCREFVKYFNTSVGEYMRTIKIQKAVSLLSDQELSLTEISAKCGFADQSHFIRCFKMYHQLTPLHYRKLLLKK
jgi:AraC family transcriptional regulator